MPDLTVNTAEFEQALVRWMAGSKRTLEEGMRRQLKTIVRNIIRITPPGHSVKTDFGNSVIDGTKAKKAGENAIKTDLLGGRRNQGKGGKRYGVFMVIGDDLLNKRFGSDPINADFERLWVTKDGRVYGAQKHFYRPNASVSEMRDHHRQYFQNGRMSSAGSYTRDIGRWSWIDQMIVSKTAWNEYYKYVKAKVFKLAAGWVEAAEEFDVAVPASIKRHNSDGAVQIDISEEKMSFFLINKVPYAGIVRDLQRRIQWAVDVQARNMNREVLNQVQQAAQRAGLTIIGAAAS